MFRAFIAIDLSENIRAALVTAQTRLKQTPTKVKVAWTKVENLHLTLQFLGRIPESQAGPIGAALVPVADRQAAFEVTVAGIGAFPDLHAPRILWIGCHDTPASVGDHGGSPLRKLVADIQSTLRPLGFQPDEHEFTAHLTLGRVKTPRPDAALTEALDSIKKDAFGTLRVAAIHLYQSQLHPDGSVYTKLSSHALTGRS